jgi:ribosomal protein S18 acetylase RimI-like enzyme
MKFVRHISPAHFLQTAGDWLLDAEAEHGLLLGLAGSRVGSGEDPDPAELFATIQEGDRVEGCIFRTPPHPLGLTRMPEFALPLAARQVASVYDSLPGVLGPPDTVGAFAEIWSGMHRVPVRPGLEMEILVLGEPIPPPHPAPGRMRVATAADRERLEGWGEGFVEEAGINATGADNPARALLDDGSLYVWEDGGREDHRRRGEGDDVVSMAGALGPTPHGIRIGYVYTPPELRGRGYASALVSELSRQLLAQGRDFCFLYVDRANPVSRGIYRRLGYRPVAVAAEFLFGAAPLLSNAETPQVDHPETQRPPAHRP